ncbi:phosphatase PAP2 family protein [Clostridium sp. D2Q-11]|uniref:Phosphatase PAP2 family protein n=1 Tax=Anaeromonas frigoriresistens TaxID=2683708 RepID=A0A942UYY8_9FIRM|nr:phosphatase PAP2 family protein [Anaeromonas frigoriresistens]MBS4538891.1 phosphatase PAP2 family protein [Anaeromonas frigoriresistens]
MIKDEKEIKRQVIPVLLLLIGFGGAGLFFSVFTEIAENIASKELQVFDDAIINFFLSIESKWIDQFMFLITEMGSVWFLTLLSIITVLILWFKKRDIWAILFFIIAMVGGGLIIKGLKYYYQRSRPSIIPHIDAVGFSFPSGHAMGSLIFYGFMIYFIFRSKLSKIIKWSLSFFATILFILIGISRIYLGAHYPSDVIAGQMSGAIWLIVTIMALEGVKWQRRNHFKPIEGIRNILMKIFK